MPDLNLHIARVRGETVQGADVKVTGYSGNVVGAGRLRFNNAASIFRNYLDELTPDAGAGGKSAFTCAEPQAIIQALQAGASFSSLWVYQIQCAKTDRAPCGAWCSQYLVKANSGYGYVLRGKVRKQLEKLMPRY